MSRINKKNMDNNFEIFLSENEGHWLVKDYEYDIEVEFEHGKFNETQRGYIKSIGFYESCEKNGRNGRMVKSKSL